MLDRIDYLVERIDGEYALLKTADGEYNRVAMALLPPETDEGQHLVWEDLQYRIEPAAK